jgi:endonuclease/exonuclease/phosphatase family metal-dependent hydrolase
MRARRVTIGLAIALAALAAAFFGLVWFASYHPADVESAAVTCGADAPILEPGQKVKVLSWNVQYMAGKNYVFYYDLLDGSGPDERPSAGDIAATLDEVARVIRDEAPDIVLLQEVDDGARRTDHADQLALLLERLPESYACHCSAFYWKARWVPHPRILGSVGMKLSIISKYRIGESVRHQLPLMTASFIVRQFNLKRAVLEAHLPVRNGKDFIVLDTHLDAFAQGSDTMERQVAAVKALLEKLSDGKYPWILGGDFNLLPPGGAYGRLAEKQRAYYNEKTEIAPLFGRYPSVPGAGEVDGPDPSAWFTHFSNDPAVKAPDRTIDYIFMSKTLTPGEHHVRRHDTLGISDHLPVVAVVGLP